MAKGIYNITEQFEEAICKYTGAPFCVTVDNQSNALFLALTFDKIKGKEIKIPNRTYPSVPCEIIHAGGIVKFYEIEGEFLVGSYLLRGSNVVDSALRFTYNMYNYLGGAGKYVCLSFTGPYKHLKLGKGGAILTDNEEAYKWFKRARFSGRREMPYDKDNLDMLGWNFYMLPELATRGLRDMLQFYSSEGEPIPQEDKRLRYPDLSQFDVYTRSVSLST